MTKKQIFFGLLLASVQTFAQKEPSTYANTILADDLKKHLTFIASDSLQGRDTGSEGQNKAAAYISDHFFQLGLTPIVPTATGAKSYFQTFNLYKKGWKEVYVKIGDKKKIFFQDFYPNGIVSIPDEKSMPVVFVGYGIESETYHDYKDIDVKDKAVVFFEGEPKDKKGNFRISKNQQKSDWNENAGLQKKINIAREKGAKFFFMIAEADAEMFKTRAAERRAVLSRFNRLAFTSTPERESANASFVVSDEMATEMLGINKRKLKKFLAKATKRGISTANKIPESSISVKSERGDELVETKNILGFMEGTDKKDEVVVITAHYDHVGVDNKGEIYNGADDDGSGTCAVMEIAEAFAQAKRDGNGPRRSILFMTVTGEEKGLLGSQYYTDMNPIIPLANTVCDLNIDMIGRIDKAHEKDEKYTYLIGSDKLSSELHQISEESNKKYINYSLDYTYNDTNDPNRFYYRSDHYNFAKNKIPVIFYFTGVHEDYHKPSDDVEKIMFPKYQQITRLIFYTTWELANRENRIKVDSNKP